MRFGAGPAEGAGLLRLVDRICWWPLGQRRTGYSEKMGHTSSSTVEKCERPTKKEQVCAFVSHCDRASSAGSCDPGLSEAGTHQSMQLASQIASHLRKNISPKTPVVIAEPCFCCVQTACEICQVVEAPLIIDLDAGVSEDERIQISCHNDGERRPLSSLVAYAQMRDVKLLACVGDKQPDKLHTPSSSEQRFLHFFNKYARASGGKYRNLVVVTKLDALAIACRALFGDGAGIQTQATEGGTYFLARRNVEAPELLHVDPHLDIDRSINLRPWSFDVNDVPPNQTSEAFKQSCSQKRRSSWQGLMDSKQLKLPSLLRRRASDNNLASNVVPSSSTGQARSETAARQASTASRRHMKLFSSNKLKGMEREPGQLPGVCLEGSFEQRVLDQARTRKEERKHISYAEKKAMKQQAATSKRTTSGTLSLSGKEPSPQRDQQDPCVSVDYETTIPEDLFVRMMNLGAEARSRGQHHEDEAPGLKRCLHGYWA